MENKLRRQELRREFSRSGWILLAYWGIMNAVVGIVTFFDVFIHTIISAVHSGNGDFMEQIPQIVQNSLLGNGWGYILCCAVGLLILFLWKGKKYIGQEIFATENQMSGRKFLVFLLLMLSCQFAAQLLFLYQETLLNMFGMSMEPMMESAALTSDSLSMFLYAGIVAPLAEELLFRGLILRGLQPYGKKLAIFGSAFLFGMFHGNMVQTPFAFLVGLILGYAATEYSILWSMVLHMFNNMIVSDFMTRILSGLPEFVGYLWQGLLLLASIGAVIYLVANRRRIRSIWSREKTDKEITLNFILSPGVVVFTVLMWLNIMVSLFAMGG